MEPQEIANELASLPFEDRLAWIATHLGRVVFSTSFGKEDQAITSAIARRQLPIRIFTLETGRLFEETLALYAITRERYGLSIEPYFPDAAQLRDFVGAKGPNAFYESVETRRECCRIRKVEPLRKALEGADVWVTGLRRGQSENRSSLPFAEWDQEHGIVKVHPLLDWDEAQLDAYIFEHNIPVNRLHAKGYPSIGCAPCTRAVAPGQDPRSGRWWWEDATKRECGLHA